MIWLPFVRPVNEVAAIADCKVRAARVSGVLSAELPSTESKPLGATTPATGAEYADASAQIREAQVVIRRTNTAN